MPYSRRRVRSARAPIRRRGRRATRYTRRSHPRTKSIGFPPVMRQRMKVSDDIQVAPASTFKSFTFQLNDIYDFFGSDGANQPNGFDQIAGVIYNRFYVPSGVVRLRFSNETANDVAMIAYLTEDVNVASTYEEAIERSKCKSVIMTAVTGSKASGSIVMPFSTSNLIKRRSDDVYGTATSSPADMCYLQVWLQSRKSSGAANMTGMLYVESWQNVNWSDRIDLAKS